MAMCREGDKKGGIPREIIVSSKEAHDIIREINFLRIQANSGKLKDRKPVADLLTLTPTKLTSLEDPFQPAHLVNQLLGTGKQAISGISPDDVSDHTVAVICACWIKGSITVHFKYNNVKIPIVIEALDKQVKIDSPQ